MIIQQQKNGAAIPDCMAELRLFAKMFFDEDEDVQISSYFNYADGRVMVYTQIDYRGSVYTYELNHAFNAEAADERMKKKVFTACVTRSFIHAAQKIRRVNIPWGAMCGIRPAKNYRELWESGLSEAEVRRVFAEVYEVSPEKIALAEAVAHNERAVLERIDPKSVGIYIGIPFCPTRCVYCSFVSTDIRVSGKYMAEFVDKLLLEIDKTAQILRDLGLYADNIYIGGGTPTTLSAEDIRRVCDRLHEGFDFSRIREFTLEAGRPDTITREKLQAALDGGVDRISINPQSMNQSVLERVGRTHSPQMVRDCFRIARELGIGNINMDLIAGLPGETAEMFKRSLDEVIALDPENITVHSLSIKRAADYKRREKRLADAQAVNEMLSYTQARMAQTQREPYYMYRQKNTSGNLENVGYAKAGFMNAYNINIMEEKQTIIALGGGGSSKLVLKDSIERVFNFKDPLEYIRRFDEILAKKDEIKEILCHD